MGDSDIDDYVNVFWEDQREEDYGGVFASENQSFNHQDSGSNSIRLSHHQEGGRGDGDSRPISEPMPLGLTLTKTSSFMNLLQKTYDEATRMDELVAPPPLPDQKLKASNFPAFYIRIGTWERITRYEGDLTAKMYYAKRKLVWEVLEGPLKNKIEIQWSDITAIRALTPENQPGILEIELDQPPLFYREINPQPRKHTIWQQSSDFTGGQAPTWRRHYVSFPPGILDKHYEKLLQCDQRLLKLTENPFPPQDTPFFDSPMFGVFNAASGSNQSPYNAYLTTMDGNAVWNSLSQPPDPSMAAADTNNSWPSLQQPPMEVMDYSYTNNNLQFVATPWGEAMSYEANVEQQFLGESSHLDMVSCAQTNGSDQMMAANYYDIDEAALYSQPQPQPQPQPQHADWVQPPRDQQIHNDIDALLMEQQINNVSLPPYYNFQADHNPTNGGFL